MNDLPPIRIGSSSYLKGRIGWQGLRASEFTAEGPYLVTGTDFLNGGIAWDRCYHVTDERFAEAPYIHVRDGDLLITKDGTIGKVAYVEDCPDRAVLNSGIFLLRCNDGSYLPRYGYYVLTSFVFDQFLRLNLNGSTINHLYQQTFVKFEFPRRTIPVQKKVASILTCIDTAIERAEALVAKYQQIKTGLMQDLFTRGVLPTGQLRPTREQAPELYRDTAIGWIPSEWSVTELSTKARPGTSWIRTGPFGSSLKGEHWRVDGHPVITIGALGIGEFIASELLFVGPKDAARLADFQLKSGDVVFSRVADVGRSVVVRDEQAGWIMSSNLMRIAVDAAQLRPDYLQMQLAGDSRLKAQIRASVNSGGRDVANSEVLGRLRFVCPDPHEQDRVISKMNQLMERLNVEMSMVAKLRTQKLGLMQDLLTGKVPVKVDESAAEPVDA